MKLVCYRSEMVDGSKREQGDPEAGEEQEAAQHRGGGAQQQEGQTQPGSYKFQIGNSLLCVERSILLQFTSGKQQQQLQLVHSVLLTIYLLYEMCTL